MATSFEVVRGANGNPRTLSPKGHSETEETRETRSPMPMPMPMRSPKLNIHNTYFRGGGDTWVTPEHSPKIHARAHR